MAKKPVRPRNWKAMREDRVLAMASNRFGRSFASKADAIAELAKLPAREQRSLKKTHMSKRLRGAGKAASDRMIAGMSAKPRAPAAPSASSKMISGMSRSGRLGAALAVAATVGAMALQSGQAMANNKTSNKTRQREAEAAKAKAEAERAASESKAREAEANAKAKAAEAEARAAEAKAKADADKAKSEADREASRAKQKLDELKADKDKRQAEREAYAANLNMIANTAGVVGGAVVGKKVANKVKADVDASEKAKAREAKKLAKSARGAKGGSSLKGVAKAANDLKLTRAQTRGSRALSAAGKMGLPFAAGMVVEGVIARTFARELEESGNVEGAAIARGFGMAGTVAAVALVGSRAQDLASPSVIPDSRAVAKIEQAKIDADGKPKRARKVPAKAKSAAAGAAEAQAKPATRAETVAKIAEKAGASVGKEAKAMASSIPDRLKGLKKAQLQQVAKEVGVSAKGTAATLRTEINKHLTERARYEAKNSVARQVRPWGGPDVDQSQVKAAAAKGRAAGEKAVHSAIDKVAGKPAGWSDAARDASAKARAPANASPLASDPMFKKMVGKTTIKSKADLDKRLAAVREARAPAKPAGPSVAEMRKTAKDAGIKGSSLMSKNALGAALRSVGKLALPVLATAAAVSAFNDSAEAGETTAAAVGKGAKAGADVVTFGAVSTFDDAKAQGDSDVKAAAKGIAKGVVSYATLGTADIAEAALAERGGVAKTIADTVKDAAGKIAGWSDAAREASAESRADAADNSVTGMGTGVGKIVGGGLVAAVGASYDVPKHMAPGAMGDAARGFAKTAKGVGAALAVVGALELATGAAKADDGKEPPAPPAEPKASAGERVVDGAFGAAGLAMAKMFMSEAKSGVGPVAKVGLRAGGALAAVTGVALLAKAVSGGANAEEAAPSAPPANPSTPESTGGQLARELGAVVVGGVGGAMALEGRAQFKERGLPVDGRKPTPMQKALRGAKGLGLIAAGASIAAAAIAVGGKRSANAAGAPDGKAYLNPAAEKKAATVAKPAAPISAGRKPAAAKPSSDGQTETYTRRGKNGQSVTVKAYRTPKKAA